MTPPHQPSGIEARLRALRNAGTERAASLAKGFDDIVEAASDVATDDEHDPEGHTIAWERQQIAALLAETQRSIAEIDDALQRALDGTYGICTTCGCAIGSERLEALPAVRACVTCAATAPPIRS